MLCVPCVDKGWYWRRHTYTRVGGYISYSYISLLFRLLCHTFSPWNLWWNQAVRSPLALSMKLCARVIREGVVYRISFYARAFSLSLSLSPWLCASWIICVELAFQFVTIRFFEKLAPLSNALMGSRVSWSRLILHLYIRLYVIIFRSEHLGNGKWML